MTLATLSIDLEARLAKLDEGMTRAQRLVERSGAQMERAFVGATRAATGLITIVGGVGFGALARSVLNGVDALNDFADATGTSVENASALEDIARRTGTSVDTAAGSLVKFNSQLAESAKKESDAARIFQKLGLNAAELRKLDPAEALLRTAQALQGFADDGDKARIVQELFGKSVREVAPFLKDLAEAGRLNATVTTDQAKAAEDFNKAIFSLQKDITDLARSMLSDAIPALQAYVREYKAAREAFGGTLGAFGASASGALSIKSPTEGLTVYRDKLAEVRGEIEQLADARAKSSLPGFLSSDAARLKFLKNEETQLAKLLAYYERLVGQSSVAGGRGNVVPSISGKPSLGALGDKEKPSQALTDALKRIEGTDEKKIARLREELAALFGMRNVPAGAFTALGLELLKLDPAARAAAESLKFFDEAVEKAADARVKADEAARRAVDQIGESNDALRAEIELIGKSADERARLEQTRVSNVIVAKEEELATLREIGARQEQIDTLAREIELLRQRRSLIGIKAAAEKNNENIPDLAGSASKASDAARELGLTFSSAFEDAIVNGEKFSDVLKGIEKDILRIVLRKAVTEPLANSIAGLFGGGGASTSGKDSAGVNYGGFVGAIAQFFAGGFAKGGYIPPGQFGLTGENGAELVSGGRTGKTITPMGRSSTFVFNAAPGGSRMSSQQQAQDFFRLAATAAGRNG